MPSLTFITEARCVACGRVERGRQFAWGCRVNKNSINVGGRLICRPQDCRECGHPTASSVPTELVYLDPESAEKVAAIRQRRWPASFGSGGSHA